MQRYNTHPPKSKFFRHLISHLESFPHPQRCIQPFIYRHSGTFSTHKKKMKSGYAILSSSPYFYIHMMICSEPKLSPLQIVRRLFQMSTTAIWNRHENYLRHIFYRENTFWTDGYFVSSVGNVSQETIKKYIENQG